MPKPKKKIKQGILNDVARDLELRVISINSEFERIRSGFRVKLVLEASTSLGRYNLEGYDDLKKKWYLVAEVSLDKWEMLNFLDGYYSCLCNLKKHSLI